MQLNNTTYSKKSKHLNENDLKKIEGFLIGAKLKNLGFVDSVKNTKKKKLNKAIKQLASLLGRSEKTIKREIHRGMVIQKDSLLREYYSYSSEVSIAERRKNLIDKGSGLKIDKNMRLAKYLSELILAKYSPYAALEMAKKNGYEVNISEKTLYNYIHSGLLESFGVTSKNLPYKQSKWKQNRKERIQKNGGKSIEKRPEEINKREELNHWEIDTVMGKAKGKSSCLLVLTERKSRREIIEKLDKKTMKEVVKGIKRVLRRGEEIKSLTSDNGSEFADAKSITKLGIEWYYCHPYSSGERGSNENNNKMIRRYIKKGERIGKYSVKEIKEIEEWINNYPRKKFKGKSSKEVYEEMLADSKKLMIN